METKANYVTVGIFTIVLLLAAFGFVYWTAGIGESGDTVMLRVRIPGSASGLGRGSFVLFNGVRVGDVRRVYIDVENPSQAIADTEIDRNTPVTASTRALIGLAGLTGQANVELSGANPSEPRLIEQAEAEGRIPEITAEPSAVTNLLQTAQDIFGRADRVLGELEGFASDARGPLTTTVQNVERFSTALARNADGIDKFLASVSTLSDELAGVSGKLDGTLRAAENLLTAVDRDKVADIVGNLETFTRGLRESSGQFQEIVAGVDTAVKTIQTFAQRSNDTLNKVDGIVEGVDPDTIRSTLANVQHATEQARLAVADVTKLTSTIGGRADDVDQMITDARELAQRLNAASVRVDGVLAKVDSLLGSEDAQKVLGEANSTLRSFRETAETVNTRLTLTLAKVDGILQGVDGAKVRTALDNIEQASGDARTAAADVAKVTSKFGDRAEDIDQIITDAGQLAQRLNAASVRVDGVLAKVDSLLGSDETQGVVADARATLKSFRQVADTLNARLGTITAGLARFSGAGLRDVEALVRDGRRAITRIEEAITDLERNPQRILTGGEGTVRQYDGRARR